MILLYGPDSLRFIALHMELSLYLPIERKYLLIDLVIHSLEIKVGKCMESFKNLKATFLLAGETNEHKNIYNLLSSNL